jgi:hypothetical protein
MYLPPLFKWLIIGPFYFYVNHQKGCIIRHKDIKFIIRHSPYFTLLEGSQNKMIKNNIALFISGVSLIISVFSVIYQAYSNHAKITLSYRSHFCGEGINFYLTIENYSRLDISISRMFLIVNEKTFEFRYTPKVIITVATTKGREVTDRKELLSTALPFTIKGLGAVGGYFSVLADKSTVAKFETPVTLLIKVYTNRGIFSFPINAINNKDEDIY